MVPRIKGLDQVLIYDSEEKHQGWSGLNLLIQELKSYQFDKSIIFFRNRSSSGHFDKQECLGVLEQVFVGILFY